MQEVDVQSTEKVETQKPVAKTGKKIKIEKKTVITGVTAFVVGFLAGFGSFFGVSKIKSSKK